MKKMKFGFGEGGFQGFMVRHVEKIVLTVVVGLMAFFIYSGSTTKSLENKNLTRESLKKSAEAADLQITNSSWDPIEIERRPKINPFQEVSSQVAKVDADLFAPPVWDVTLIPRLKPRTDPRLYGAENLVATPIFGPLVLTPPEMEDEEEDVDPSKYDPLQKYPVTIGGSGGMGFGGAPAMPTMGADEEEKEEKKPRRRKGKQDEATEGYPMAGAGPTMGAKSTKRPAATKKPKDKDKDDEETYPGMAAGSYGSGQKGRTIPAEATVGVKAPQGSQLKPITAIVVTASIPYAKQWEEFRAAFKDAPGGQDPSRDVPNYVTMFVERLDVTDDPDNQNWENLSRPAAAGAKSKARQFEELEKLYGAEVMEIIDPESVDPKLTHPIPPLLLTDLSAVMTHPDVPRVDPKKLRDFEEEGEMEEDPEFTEDGLYIGESDDEDEGMGTGRSAPRTGGSKMAGPSRMPGASRPAGAPRMPAAGGRMAMPGAGGRMGGAAPRGGGAGAMPRGALGGRGMGAAAGRGAMAGGGAAGDLDTYKPIPKKLVRFVDFDAKQGRNYRYRIQLVVEDPNHPQDPDLEPEENTLDDKARDRVKAVKAKEAGGGRRTFYVTSPWSEPSAVVSVPSQEKFYAGETVPGTTVPMANGKVTVATGEPTAKVLAVQWDQELGVFAPMEQTVMRGSVLNTRSDVEVLHPVEGNVRKIPEYQIRTNGVVLDMFGGEVLPGSDSRDLERAPGETLILDASGNLIVTDESRDVEGYRRYIFPEPQEEPKQATGTPMGPGGADYPMAPGKKGKSGSPMGPGGSMAPGKTRPGR